MDSCIEDAVDLGLKCAIELRVIYVGAHKMILRHLNIGSPAFICGIVIHINYNDKRIEKRQAGKLEAFY